MKSLHSASVLFMGNSKFIWQEGNYEERISLEEQKALDLEAGINLEHSKESLGREVAKDLGRMRNAVGPAIAEGTGIEMAEFVDRLRTSSPSSPYEERPSLEEQKALELEERGEK